MLTHATRCPRCGERSVLTLVYADAVDRNGQVETVFRCAHCQKLSILRLVMVAHVVLQGAGAVSGDLTNAKNLHFLAMYPDPPKTEIPEGLDERVASAYKDGKELLLQRRWTPAASAFRTTLDRATKILWRGVTGNDEWPKDLSPRIQALKAKLGLPDAITDWAHQVRIVGNEIHDLEDVEEDDAKDVGHFAEVFLAYTFTLPKRLAAFRERRDAK